MTHNCLRWPFLLILIASNCARAGTVSKPGPWCPDNGDRTYKNPIIFADYSDPDVIRVGNDFYLTASSFSCFPGLPILHSMDLVNWTIIGHAIDKYPVLRFNTPAHGCGVWAPAIRFHDGQFYIFFGDPDNGIFMAKATNPAGPWNPLVRVKDSKGWIDTCPFWDDDGTAYLVHGFAGSRAGISNALDINRMSPDGTKLLDDGKRVFNGKDANYTTLEGPKLYKRNGYYYIMAPGGGVGGGYQIVFRSKNIHGPYDSRVVLRQGKTNVNGPHQGAWVQTQTGQDWFIHFQEYPPYGRLVHLQPVRWVDDWPIMGDAGEPVMSHAKPDVGKTWPVAVPQTSDEFDQPSLGLQWQWWANLRNDWISLTDRPGFLRMKAVASTSPSALFDHPNLLLQKFPAETFTATANLDLTKLADGDRAGLVVAGLSTGALQVERTPAGLKLFRSTFIAHRPTHWNGDPLPESDIETDAITIPGDKVFLRVGVSPGGVCNFSYCSDDKRFNNLGPTFTAANDLWIGAKVGLFCNAPVGKSSTGFVDVDWFRVGN
jgi:beta-xylosidase